MRVAVFAPRAGAKTGVGESVSNHHSVAIMAGVAQLDLALRLEDLFMQRILVSIPW